MWCAVLCSVVWRSLGRGGSAFRRTDPFFKTAYQICMRIYVCGIDLELEQGRVPRSEVGEIKKKNMYSNMCYEDLTYILSLSLSPSPP